MKKIKNTMISGLVESPYNLSRNEILELYEKGEVVDMEYYKPSNGEGEGIAIKFEIATPVQ